VHTVKAGRRRGRQESGGEGANERCKFTSLRLGMQQQVGVGTMTKKPTDAATGHDEQREETRARAKRRKGVP